jgi:hypothetical protein
MAVVWDLCSGLGGWSEAFVQNGFEVIRIENNPDLDHVPHTLMLDILEWREWAFDLPHPDIILCSPPCRGFSNAFGAPRAIAQRAGEEYQPDMSILNTCMEIIGVFNPAWWAVENVAGAIKYFKPVIGNFKQKVGPFFLWGNIPHLHLAGFKHSKATGDSWSTDPLRANKRALIPFEVSFELFQALRDQTTLERWLP